MSMHKEYTEGAKKSSRRRATAQTDRLLLEQVLQLQPFNERHGLKRIRWEQVAMTVNRQSSERFSWRSMRDRFSVLINSLNNDFGCSKMALDEPLNKLLIEIAQSMKHTNNSQDSHTSLDTYDIVPTPDSRSPVSVSGEHQVRDLEHFLDGILDTDQEAVSYENQQLEKLKLELWNKKLDLESRKIEVESQRLFIEKIHMEKRNRYRRKKLKLKYQKYALKKKRADLTQ